MQHGSDVIRDAGVQLEVFAVCAVFCISPRLRADVVSVVALVLVVDVV